MSEKCCHEHIGGDTPALAQKPCECVSIETTYVKKGATIMEQGQTVTILGHTGSCPRSDEIVGFGR